MPAEHHCTTWFMAGVEEIVAESRASKKPSFLERAKARWGKRQTDGAGGAQQEEDNEPSRTP
jgi:hypothetical protein